jgi:hypothetical protein
MSKVAVASTIPKTSATRQENRGKSLTIFVMLAPWPAPTFLGLNLLLLLDCGPDFLTVLVIIRQPQPDLRHVG